jgi:hypothetical protein
MSIGVDSVCERAVLLLVLLSAAESVSVAAGSICGSVAAAGPGLGTVESRESRSHHQVGGLWTEDLLWGAAAAAAGRRLCQTRVD